MELISPGQLTISRSPSAVVLVLDPVATTGVISDASSFFAACKSDSDAVSSSDRIGALRSESLVRDAPGAVVAADHAATTPSRDEAVHAAPHSSSSLEPNLESLVLRCASPSRLVLVWWPRIEKASSSLLLQIFEEAMFDAGVERTLPTPDQFCVIIGKSILGN